VWQAALRYAGRVDEGNFLGLLIGALGAVSIALQRRREILGPWRTGHANLGDKKYSEAEVCFRQSLAIAERRFGPNHWRTAIHVNALAQALLGQKRHAEASTLTERALGIVDCWKPTPHPQLTIVFVGAAALAREGGDLDGARDLLTRARREARGDGEILGAIERTLFSVETRAGRPREAADALARMPPHAITERGVHAMVRVAMERTEAGDAERGAAILAVVVAAVANARFLQFPEAFYRGMLGQALARAGMHEDARRELDLAVHDYEALLGPGHPAAAPVLVALAEALERLGDAAGARDACHRVLALGAARETAMSGPYRESAAPSDPLEHDRNRAREVLERVRRAT
jgi:tetratricopeptide (TPR) repeat protein